MENNQWEDSSVGGFAGGEVAKRRVAIRSEIERGRWVGCGEK